MLLLDFQNVSYISDNKTILKDLSIKIDSGEFISIVGPSGSGKSTFLKLCCHLISPTYGNIIYRNKDLMLYSPTELRRSIAYCFQTPYLFGETVEENISFPFFIRNLKASPERVYELFNLFNIDKSFLKSSIKNLSGGEKQRIALIRTLLFKPDILLLDEITSALDVDNALIIEEVIKSLNQEEITILWITHNPEQSKKYAHKLLTIENGEFKSMEELK